MSIDFSPSLPGLNRNRFKDHTEISQEDIGDKKTSRLVRFEAYWTQRTSTKSELAQAAFRGDIPSKVTSVLEQNGALEKGWRTRETS